MAASIGLDKSGWGVAAQGRLAALEASKRAFKALEAAKAGHPLADALVGLPDATLAASSAPRYLVKVMDFGNGHREATVARRDPDLQRTLDRAIDRDLNGRVVRGEGDRDANVVRAVRHAKQKVRHLAKAMLVNSLWTLTYRANVQDRELVLGHLDKFRRRVVAVLGEWRYIAFIEKQERGAFHVHVATHSLPMRIERGGVKVKSWDVMRAIWRRVVGELGGNFDEAKRRGRWGTNKRFKGAGAIASYLAGYIAKDMEQGELNRKRYSASKGVVIPVPERAEWGGDSSMADLMALAYSYVGVNLTRVWFDAARGVFFVESDDSVPVGGSG